MKKRDLFGLLQGINKCSELKDKAKEGNVVKFHYACSKNKAKIISELKHVEGTLQNDPAWDTFNKEKDALLQKFAEKDENGVAIRKQINEFSYEYETTEENKALLKPELDKFLEEKAEAIKEREEKIKKYNELLDEEADVEIHKVDIKDIPGDIIQEQMDLIMEMIKDESDK